MFRAGGGDDSRTPVCAYTPYLLVTVGFMRSTEEWNGRYAGLGLEKCANPNGTGMRLSTEMW